VVAATVAALDGLRLGAGSSDGRANGTPATGDPGVASVPPPAEPRLDATGVPRLAARERAEGVIPRPGPVPSVLVLEADDLASVEREIAGVLTSNQVQFEQVAAAQVQPTPAAGEGVSVADSTGSREAALARESMPGRSATGTNPPGVSADTPFRGLPADGAATPGAEAGPVAQVASNESVYVARKLSRVQVQAINDALVESAGRQRSVRQAAVAPEAKLQYQNLAQRPAVAGFGQTAAQEGSVDGPRAEPAPRDNTAVETASTPTADFDAQDVVIVVRGRDLAGEPVQPAHNGATTASPARSDGTVPPGAVFPSPTTAPAEPTTVPATQPN
jgi:hypothetical protein